MAFNLKRVLKFVGDAIDPTPGDLLSGALFGRVANETGHDPSTVEQIIGAFTKDPETVRIQMEGQKALAELSLEYSRVESANLRSLEPPPSEKPSVIMGLFGSARRFAVTASTGTLCLLALMSGIMAIFTGTFAKDPAGLKIVLWALSSVAFGMAGVYSAMKTSERIFRK